MTEKGPSPLKRGTGSYRGEQSRFTAVRMEKDVQVRIITRASSTPKNGTMAVCSQLQACIYSPLKAWPEHRSSSHVQRSGVGGKMPAEF